MDTYRIHSYVLSFTNKYIDLMKVIFYIPSPENFITQTNLIQSVAINVDKLSFPFTRFVQKPFMGN